jgi:hypothetical protein
MYPITRRNNVRILDNKAELSMKNISIFLTKAEASELLDTIEELIKNSDKDGYHLHLNDEEYSHEVTFSIYSEKNIKSYNARTQRLLIEDV